MDVSRHDTDLVVSPRDGGIAAFTRDFERILRSEGLHHALRLLNERVRFRFTGAYRFEPPLLRNLSLFDRENPNLDVRGDINPIKQAFCSIVHATDAPFQTEDAATDPRVRDHPARKVYLSYCGVPLRSVDGTLWGVLCYFDFRPRLMTTTEVPYIDAAASSLSRIVTP